MSDIGKTVEKRLSDYMGFQVWKIIDNKGLGSEKVTYMLNTQDGDNVDCFSTLSALKKGVRCCVSEN